MRYLRLLFMVCCTLCAFTGCLEEETTPGSGEGEGWLVIGGITIDLETADGTAITRGTFEAPDASELVYIVTNTAENKGEVFNGTNFPPSKKLPCGNYRLEVKYGENKMSDKPYLYTSETFSIAEGETTTLSSLSVGLDCAIIHPKLTDELLAQYKDGYTLTLTNTEPTSITVTNDKDWFVPKGDTYILTFNGTNQVDEAHTFSVSVNQAAAKNRYTLNCTPDLPTFQLPTQVEGDAWATKIYVNKITPNEISNASESNKTGIANQMVYQISEDGTNWTNATEEDGRTVFKGLKGSTTYQLRGYFNGMVSSNTVSVTTEAEAAVPNGDFEDLVETINISNMNDGGEYSHTITFLGIKPRKYRNTTNILVKEPSNWSSINSTTFNYNGSTNKNSWFVIPSTFNTTLTCTVTAPADVVAGGGWTETPDMYSNLNAQNGANAMVLRNVAWDLNGNEPEYDDDTKTSAHYYCNNIPSSIANRSAGELFLKTNGSEGISFNSRPLTLKGYYKYENNVDSNEAGTVLVELLSGTQIIGTGSGKLKSATTYTEFSVSIDYSIKSLVATALKIKFKSSDASSIQTTDRGEKEQCSYGATLTVDNLTFEY